MSYPQEYVEAKCQHQDHDDRATRETTQGNTLDAEPKAEHDNRSQRNGQPQGQTHIARQRQDHIGTHHGQPALRQIGHRGRFVNQHEADGEKRI